MVLLIEKRWLRTVTPHLQPTVANIFIGGFVSITIRQVFRYYV
jgi:hypothetical protein